MTTATQPHPTLEEWTARKRDAHPELISLYVKGEQDDMKERAHCDRLWDTTAAMLIERRKEFEAALTRLLESEGAGWLADYRVCDSVFAGPHRLDTMHRGWFAQFGLEAVGFYSLRVELVNHAGTHTWTPSASPWGVCYPAGIRWVRSLPEAVRCAARYQPAPF